MRPVATLLVAALPLVAESQARSTWSPAVPRAPAVARALTWLEENFPRQVEEWVRIAEMRGCSSR